MSRRLTALVIGNLAYEVACELKSPANDAEEIAVKLETWGFTAIKRTGCTPPALGPSPRATAGLPAGATVPLRQSMSAN